MKGIIAKIKNRLPYERSRFIFRLFSFFKPKIVGFGDVYLQYRPDRYSFNSKKYKERVNFMSYNDLIQWNKGNYIINGGDINRFFFINLCIDYLIEENIIGNIAELGVYKGNSAFLLSKYSKKIGTQLFLFDTYDGFDEKDIKGGDAKSLKLFKNTSLESVKKLLENEDAIYVKGYFPESLEKLKEEPDSFSLVHIDCDLELPFLSSLNYFYPRMKKGGFLIMHDHSSLSWEGAYKAINSFFADKPEFILPIPDKSGTAVIRKV